MGYYFCLDFLYIFLHHIYVGFIRLKGCSFPDILKKMHGKRSGESRITACQTLWGSKSKVAKTQLPAPCRVGLVVSVSASHTIGHGFAYRPGHTKDHHTNGTNCLPAWHAMR